MADFNTTATLAQAGYANTVRPMKADARPELQVQFDELNKALENVDKTIQGLIERLQPVLMQVPAELPPGPDQLRPSSPLGEQVSMHIRHAYEIASLLHSVVNRLAL